MKDAPMTTTPQAQPLTAEEEARWRTYAYEVRGLDLGEKMRRLFALLDAARAETEAVRRENRTALNRAVALDDLAADLVEGLNIARRRFELLAVYDDTPRNGVRPSVGAAEAETLIARARALGIGEEKGNG